jgi:glutamate racemase
VFDSGIGGLTVLRAIHQRLPAESTIYLGDTARLPYGPKSPETVRRYAAEATAFLLERGVKALVIACNTATAHACEGIAEALEIPVIGVVEPGARAAVLRSEVSTIGVIGTQGTIESGTYERAIHTQSPNATVHSAACPLFVALAEEGWVEGEVARLTAERYLRPLLRQGIDTLVLGCTHYPLLKPLIARVAGAGITLVDSAEATAAALEEDLEHSGLLTGSSAPDVREYFVTDDAERFRAIAKLFLGRPLDHLEPVDLGEPFGR